MVREVVGVARAHARRLDQLRTLKVTYDVFPYAAGSVLFEMGNTKVLCAVTLTPGVPSFLRGKKKGWLTAEYAMLPAATHQRTVREAQAAKRNGRAIEISRLIGRCWRSIVNLDVIGEQTIYLDCDVLQADGGTRTASINGICLALRAAQARWLAKGTISAPIIKEEIAAVSVGHGPGGLLLDLDFEEDSSLHADFNFVLTRTNKIIEVQGCAEREPVSWEDYFTMHEFVKKGVQDVFKFYDEHEFRLTPLLEKNADKNDESSTIS